MPLYNPISNSDLIQEGEVNRYFTTAREEAAFSFKNEFVGGATSVLTRNRGVTANAGVGAFMATNDYDYAPIYSEITEVEDSYGNVFIRIPKFYIKKTPTATGMIRQISKLPITGGYLPWCFWDFTNSVELPYIDIGKYNASLSDNTTKLESKSGKYPLVNKNIVQFRDYATANGAGYQQLDIHVVDLIQTLFYIEFGTVNSDAIARGWTSGNYSASDTATAAESGANRIIVANATAAKFAVNEPISIGTSLGDNQICTDRKITEIGVYDVDNKAVAFDGTAVNIAIGNILYNSGWQSGFSATVTAKSGSNNNLTNGKNPFVYRGIENLFGNVWQFVDGINTKDKQSWVCKNAAQYASNVFASPYEQLGYANANTDNYVIKTGFDANCPFAEIPSEVGVTGSSAYKDYYYQSAGERIALFGGFWALGATAGLSYWYLYNSSAYASLYLGGRLVKKPL